MVYSNQNIPCVFCKFVLLYMTIPALLFTYQILKFMDIKIANRSFENVSQFKCLGTTVTNQNLIQEEIKRRLNSGNA
jgi:hypothetical protein